MSRISRFPLAAVALATAFGSLAACGKVSDDQKQDAANIAAGLVNGVGKSSASSAALTGVPGPAGTGGSVVSVSRQMRDLAEGAMWLTALSQEPTGPARAGLSAGDASAATIPSCSGFNAGGCTSSCSGGDTVWNISCQLAENGTSVCNGVTYTFANTTFGMTLDVSGLSGTGAGASGTLKFGFTISANVTGGQLEGKELKCGLAFNLDIAKVKAQTEVFTPTEESFSCSYDGKDIAFDDLKSRMASSASCS